MLDKASGTKRPKKSWDTFTWDEFTLEGDEFILEVPIGITV